MKFTIFLCSAFIVSVACVTEPDEQNKFPKFVTDCLQSLDEVTTEFYTNNSLHFNSSDIITNYKYIDVLAKVWSQITQLGFTVERATSMKLPEPLVETTHRTKIVCSKELADQVAEIIKNGYEEVNAIHKQTVEDRVRNWITYSNQGVISIPAA